MENDTKLYKLPFSMILLKWSVCSNHIHTQRKQKSSFQGLCGEQLSGNGHRFSLGEINMGLKVMNSKFLKINSTIELFTEDVSL
jgi:hypothetical protein